MSEQTMDVPEMLIYEVRGAETNKAGPIHGYGEKNFCSTYFQNEFLKLALTRCNELLA